MDKSNTSACLVQFVNEYSELVRSKKLTLVSTLINSIKSNGLRAGVYNMSDKKYIIPLQSIENLKIIMRSIYLQYAEHYEQNITQQVERLNKLVLDYCIPNVYNEAVGYEKYCKDQSTLVVPLELPKHHDRQYKQNELHSWM